MNLEVLCFFCYLLLGSFAIAVVSNKEERPYEFSFNITDFQHRFEKKDADGIITGEFGFITADGVYHETGYATDKNDDFIITRMRYRKITSLKDALEIFKDRPETARRLVEAVAKACSGCKIPIEADKMADTAQTTPATRTTTSRANLGPLLEKMAKTLVENAKLGGTPSKEKPFQERNKIPENFKDSLSSRRGKSLLNVPERNTEDASKEHPRKEGNDLFYRFNYTITSHEHQETGFRSGAKDGSYRAQSENGVDTRVKYLSNEFGHQPNISFVPTTNGTTESQRLKGYSFLWYWS